MSTRTPYTAPPLTRDRILDAALAVGERDGLDGLSMRVVARELGVSTMASYRHVANKDDLLDGLVERLLGELTVPDETLPPEQRLRMLAAQTRELAQRHPALFELLLRRRAVGAGTVARDATIAALCEAGFDAETAAQRERLLSTFVLGFALSEVAGRFSHIDVDAEFADALDLLGRLVVA